MGTIRKRGAVYGVIGLMLCVAVYLNWSYFQSPEELMNVSGIGEKTYAGLAEQIIAGAANQEGIE